MPTQRAVSSAFDSGFLNLILFATERCNFRCTYCYEKFAHGKMRPDVVAGVKRLIERRATDLRRLEISWFGGEPLLAKDLMLDVSRHASAAAEGAGFAHAGNATTNGYHLDLASAEQLVEAGVHRFHISLDGPAELHDQTRRQANGRGSFERIWSNLLALESSDLEFEVLLRIHATPGNRARLGDLMDQLNDAFEADSRFKVYVKQVSRLGGPNDDEMSVLDRSAAVDLAGSLQSRLAPSLREDAPDGEDYVCYAARPNSLAIRADGSVAKCTVALYDDRNRLGSLRADGSLAVDQAKLKPWLRGFESGKAAELACPLAGMPAVAEKPAIVG